ncbi:serine carboxypeptidase-like 14 [Lolium rigidum]|uniref:serine carboxypeptidase-like 14 n=1 Tax=Lolium rigidum TaxID=89674 RepID=UPI001F5CE9E3|nr:serine carboxypeptidase-like 14 [Lolium rigidum]
MEVQLQAPRPRRLLFFLICFFSGLATCRSAVDAPPTLIDSLPGFDGALPFRLETGYVTVDEENGGELFYYFIESEGDPRRDPLLLWLPGGDRCTVLQALLLQLGPLRFVIEPYNGTTATAPRLHHHPYSWTKAASVLFLDSPVGAGFSFSQNPKGYDVGEVSSSLQVKTFLTKWFTEHPDYLANPFYVGGASHAGKFVPFIAQKISEDIEAGMTPTVNLKGYLVGNPGISEGNFYEWKVPYLHGVAVISDQLYESIMENCQGHYTNPTNALCARDLERFDDLFGQIEHAHILYKKCDSVPSGPIDPIIERKILTEETGVLKHQPTCPPLDCQSYGGYLSYYWSNNNITRESLGIKKGSKDEWVLCDENDMPYSSDIESSLKYHRNMTSKGYRVLVYSGDHDAIIPFLGTESWVRSLNYPILDEWRAWHLDGQSAGFTITYKNNLTFATVKGGGHSVPEYQPERGLAIFSRWISGEPL